MGARFFNLGDGTRGRSVTIRALASQRPADPPIPVTITYSGACNRLDSVLHSLLVVLIISVVVGSVTAALLSWLAAAATLRPLAATAEVLGTIEEQHLDRRIDLSRLPGELVPVATRLNEMLARLEHSYLQRKQFLADVSHELRTPLAAIATSIAITLRRPRQSEIYRSCLQACEVEVRHLKRLVEQVMEQVRSELREPSETIEHLEVMTLLEQCVNAAKIVALERNITVAFTSQEQRWLHVEPTRLRSVTMNLLFNAVEHNHDGGRVEMTATSTRYGVTIGVRDNGPGIAPGKIPHLFEPFFRGDSSRPRGAGSHLGLGLFIVQSHLNAMGGRCTVESQVGVGSEFILEIPDVVNSVTEPLEIEAQEPAAQAALSS